MFKKSLATLALATMLTTNSYALVVSDPGVYARQILQTNEITKQLDQLKQTFEQAKKMADAVTGISTRGNNANIDITDLKKANEKMLTDLLGVTTGTKATEQTIDTINRKIEDTFKSLEQDPVAARATQQDRALYRDKSNKAALQYAEYTLQKMPDQLGRIEQLSAQINQTTSMKDSQDLTNRYLAEILGMMAQSLMLQGQLVRAQSAASFSNKVAPAKKTVSKDDFNRWTDNDAAYSNQFKNMYGK